MTGVQVFSLTFSGVFVLLMVVSLLITSRRSSQERRLMRLAVTVNLAVPEHLEVELLRHIARRGRAWTIGFGATFLVVYVPLVLTLPEATLLQGVVPFFVAFIGGSAAAAVTALVDRRRGTFGAPSVGRMRGPAIRDLVPARLLCTATVIIGVSGVLAAVAVLLPQGELAEAPSGSAVLALVGVMTLTVWWWVSRALARRRPITGDAATLVWSDALRAESIRDLLLLPVLAAVFSMIGTVPAVVSALTADDGAARDIARSTTFLLPVGIMIAIVVIQGSKKTTRHYQRRLWPELAADKAAAVWPAPASAPPSPSGAIAAPEIGRV